MGDHTVSPLYGIDTYILLDEPIEERTDTCTWLGRNIRRKAIIAGTTIAFFGTLVLDAYLIKTYSEKFLYASVANTGLAAFGITTCTALSLMAVAGTGVYCYRASETLDAPPVAFYDDYSSLSSDDYVTDSDNSSDSYDYSVDNTL